ncbi:TetR/AcrR family transcriptional regulator C-terminal domain-containing protein [Amycolatopsis sp. SID8362]|uniref:TetR/AcrR family transcriptional regulator n=1 Tax=Amycolatopsis sp. SID8362 TaxID=2690346 RepID=UPI00136F9B96|nr:TetR/AcrR family transcriptional regulator C-terminal domain-containing protein [Amycolatopsis sp. SID8362]NBH02978.1 TetR family transcriptional regulator [Amycolatopsis sp. SID8362]NED39679.1 TetR/AcrR family transcriptional regulator [Amycolatopsis sp. SID8362]
MAPDSTYNRRERPAKPALTREGIVATAVAVMRAEGVERVTMRRLAKELDTGAASLYVYVKDTEELHAAVLDELLAEVDFGGAGDWRERLWAVLDSYRAVLFAHPSLARVALVTRLSGPNYFTLVEAVLALLDEGGMAPGQAAWAVDVLLLSATAAAVEHGSRREKPGAAHEHEVMVESVAAASPRTHPHIAALATDLVSGPGPVRARWAFDALLNGALATPRPGPGES